MPGGYLLLILADESDAQDAALGLGGLYLEIGDQGRGGYRAIHLIRRIGPTRAIIEFSPEGAAQFGMAAITLDLSECGSESTDQLEALIARAGVSVACPCVRSAMPASAPQSAAEAYSSPEMIDRRVSMPTPFSDEVRTISG